MGFITNLLKPSRSRAGARPRTAATLPVMEPMEGRQLMSGTLNVIAHAAHNNVIVDVSNAGGVTTNVNGVKTNYAPGQWSFVQVFSDGGSDVLSVKGTVVPTGVHVGYDASVTFQGPQGVQNIKANASVDSMYPSTFFHVAIDDTGNPTPRTGTMDISGAYEFVSGMAPGTISFDAALTQSLKVVTGGGADALNVRHTERDLTVNSSGGNDTVTIGGAPGAGASGIQGEVTVLNTPAFTHLVVDDKYGGTPAPQPTFLRGDGVFNTVQGYTWEKVSYRTSDVADVVVKTPQKGAHVYVTRTDNSTHIIGNSSALAPPDIINFGGDGALGSVQNIHFPVTLSNPTGYDDIIFNDAADTTPRSVQMYAQIVTGLAPAPIQWTNADTHSVHLDLPDVGGSSVTVRGTARPTTISSWHYANAPHDNVTIGDNHSVQGILGPVTVENYTGATDLTVDDAADPTGRKVVGVAPPDAIYTDSENGTITGLAPAQIIYRAESMGNPVAIYGGSGGNTYTVQDTPLSSPLGLAGPGIKLNTGTGADVTNVLETAVMTLNIQGQAGLDTVNVGKFGSVQGVRGTVNVQNATHYTKLTVDDSLDTTPRSFVLDSFTPFMTGPEYGSITGLAPGVINYRALDVSAVDILGGSGGNTITVNNTPSTNLGGGPNNPINLSTGGGADKVTVNAVGPDTMLNIDGQGGIDAATLGGAQSILGVVNLVNVETVTSNFQALSTRASTKTFSSTLIRANTGLDDLLAGVTHGQRVA